MPGLGARRPRCYPALDVLQKLGLALDLYADLEPVDRQRRHQVDGAVAQVDAVLLGCNRGLRLRCAKLMRQRPQLVRAVRVVIAEIDVVNWTDPQQLERRPERCRISQATKSAYAIEQKFPGRNFAPCGQMDPAFGHSACPEYGRTRIVAAQRQLQIVSAALALAARDHDDIGAHQGSERLAQASKRENLAAAERS